MVHQGLAAAVRCSRDRGPAARGDLPRWYAVLLAFGRQHPRQHLPGIDQRPGCWTQCSVARASQAVPEVGGQSIASLENRDLFSAPASRRCRLHRKCSGQPAPIAPQSAERVRISSLSTGLSTATRPSSSADAPIGRRVEAGLEPAGPSVIAGGEGLGWASGPVKTPVPRPSFLGNARPPGPACQFPAHPLPALFAQPFRGTPARCNDPTSLVMSAASYWQACPVEARYRLPGLSLESRYSSFELRPRRPWSAHGRLRPPE